MRVRTFAEYLLQQFVSDRFTRVKHALDLPVLNLKLPFELHRPFNWSGGRDIRCQTGGVVVVQTRDWRTPVIDQKAQSVFVYEGGYADIELFAEVQPILLKVDASEIRSWEQTVHVFPLLRQLLVAALPFGQYRRLLVNCIKGLFEVFIRTCIERNFFPKSLADVPSLITQSGNLRLQLGDSRLQLVPDLFQPLLFLLPILRFHLSEHTPFSIL
ncbi:hypothetical protein D3C72_1256210 [compost metagenome]